MSLVGGLDALCTGLSVFISNQKEKKVKENKPVSEQPEGVSEDENESEFSLLSRCSSALSLIESTLGEMLAVNQSSKKTGNEETWTRQVQKEIGGILLIHFPHSFTPRREKTEGVIGLDIGKEKQRMEELLQMKMKEMEAERAKNQQMMEQVRRWAEQERKRQSKVGAAAIELFNQLDYGLSGNVFRKFQESCTSIISFEFGEVVARLSLTIRKGPDLNFAVGIVSSSLSSKALTEYFPSLKGGAGWDLYQHCRDATQNDKDLNEGSACLGGREGQRVVLEADGREGKRTLKLSQDGETQPVFFKNIPVPFRFAVYIYGEHDAVEIESVEVVFEPQMVGGTIAVAMDG
ncbi:hypothetical protein BLNAU_18147 [Blattamonas nauphoetae]|uniref:Uncharacterized protein n=1 Tax=Blattamonas nauphoetae TaxID=2049346 RepID=A0ABQ9X5Q9_9EUKA|nr:hypothetical protein BLNAU_18147 [Blattamonas nauphoetae]